MAVILQQESTNMQNFVQLQHDEHVIDIPPKDTILPHEPVEPKKCCECSRSTVIIVGSLITSGSFILVTFITGVVTIIVTALHK
jgi:hypothetical protein